MFEQSFKYVANLVYSHFSSAPVKPGDRYHLRIEQAEHVEQLCKALEQKAETSFNYRGYVAPIFQFSEAKLLVASSHNATENFLTKLRNETALQNIEFQGVALLVIHNTSLDSIIGGSESLSKEGNPLHINSFRHTLSQDINKLNIHRNEKKAIQRTLNEFNSSIYEDSTTIFAYYPFMDIINAGKISLKDWRELGLFYDPELQDIDLAKVTYRVKDNSEWFEKIHNIHRYGTSADDLIKDFIHAGITDLKKEDWHKNEYGTVIKWHEERRGKTPPKYIEPEDNKTIDDFEFWERSEGSSSAASRKRHIVIFNTSNCSEIKHLLLFDRAVKQSGIDLPKKSNISAKQSGKCIELTIKVSDQNAVIERIKYDDKESSGSYIFNIAVLPFSAKILHSHRSSYLVDGSVRTRRLKLQTREPIIFNDSGAEEKRVTIQSNSTLTLTPELKLVAELDDDLIDETIDFDLNWDDRTTPCRISAEAVKPIYISGINIWKSKRETKKSFEYAGNNKLIFGNKEFFTNKHRALRLLNLEQEIVSKYNKYCFWTFDKRGLEPAHLEIDNRLIDIFGRLIDFYRKRNLIPSLTSIYESPELFQLMESYVKSFVDVLSDIEEGKPLNKQTHNLVRLGTIENHSDELQVYFTPFHPLNVAYQISIYNNLKDENIPENILACLGSKDLVPFLNSPHEGNIKLYPVLESELTEWAVYKPYKTKQTGWNDLYVPKLICDKISDYINHFPYLFTGSVKAPIRINLVNHGDCFDALKGIIKYYKNAIEDEKGNAQKIQAVALRIYNGQEGMNKFEEFAQYSDPEKIQIEFGLELKTKRFSAYDVLNLINQKLGFYNRDATDVVEYAHITFYKFSRNSTQWTYHDMSQVNTGCSLSGLTNAVPSVFSQQEYITGFGTQHISHDKTDLINLAIRFNSLARVANTQDPYSKNEAIFSVLQEQEKEKLERVYDRSNWVTFIDPKVDLNFFKINEKSKDLIIIHYSDQYNNTSGYDAITVTRKSQQYRALLNEFMRNKNLVPTESDELKLINMFNAINGDWLLQLISSRSHFPREKISILSAVKTMLAILDHPNIVWVPLSLEEVLRVSGSVGLKQTDGLFSAKNLGAMSPYCDDILMAGVEVSDDKVLLHFIPVEVKIGGDQKKKGKLQSIQTAQLIRDHLLDTTFKSKFYRNFFSKLIIIAAEKMRLYNVFPEQRWEIISEECRAHLLNDSYDISMDLDECFCKASVLSFRSKEFRRRIFKEGDCLLIEMLENDGYENLLKEPNDLIAQYQKQDTTLDEKLLLTNCYQSGSNAVVDLEDQKNKKNNDTKLIADRVMDPSGKLEAQNKKGMKILFGNDINTDRPYYWTPNDTNKVMHTNTGIIGTMGTGKTQFTKSMVTQLVWESKNNIKGTDLGFLIFDYKGDYIKDDFIKATNAKRYDLDCLPYNPLALTISDNPQPKLPLHTANSIKESIATAFHLGTVQKQKLRDCIMDAYSKFGIDKSNRETWTKPAPTLSDVCEIYMNDGEVKNDSLYAALSNLYEFEIFEPQSTKTVSLWELLQGVVVINLSGYDQDIQNLVVAITLDQFYGQMQKDGHSSIQGDYREIKKMILVDEADNFLSQNFDSIKKILKEGREFGVGTILSTQFLNHFSTGDNEYSNYILSWVVHRVSEINQKEVSALFGFQSKDSLVQLMAEIKQLKKHCSIANLADGKPVMLRDKAFWELINQNS